jgi:hypothetical protein
MRKDAEFARLDVASLARVASGSAMGVDVVVTADELITEKTPLFGRSRMPATHYALSALSGMKVSRRSPTGGQCAGCWSHCAASIPHPVASCVQLEFAGRSPASLCLIFGADAQPDFERIVSVLGPRLSAISGPRARRGAEAR